jgi:NAD(P)-dependent dehydrogenase (short-subunit alcohol dehydrogenase family)
MHELSGTTTLIVGGSSGIGHATARLFVDRGGAVIVAARRQERSYRAVAELGTAARELALDVADPLQIGQAVDALPKEGIDHLVITAATLAHGPFATHPVEEVRAMCESSGAHTRSREGCCRRCGTAARWSSSPACSAGGRR